LPFREDSEEPTDSIVDKDCKVCIVELRLIVEWKSFHPAESFHPAAVLPGRSERKKKASSGDKR